MAQLEDKIKQLLEGTAFKPDNTGSDNAKIDAGKARKLEAPEEVNGAAVAAASKGKGDGSEASTNADNAKIDAGKSRKLSNQKNQAKKVFGKNVDNDEDYEATLKKDDDTDDDDDSDKSKDTSKNDGDADADDHDDADDADVNDSVDKDPDSTEDNKLFKFPKSKKDVKEHVDALTDGEGLSEDFKAKAATILGVAINEGVAQELDRLEEEYAERLDEATNTVRDEIVEHINGFLNLMVENWMEKNALAIETGIKNEVLENFVDGLKNLFKESYIEVPEEKLNILDEQANKIDDMAAQLSESKKFIDALSLKVIEMSMKSIQESVGASLADTEYDKFVGLCEGVEFESEASYEAKLKTIKESYFTKSKRSSAPETVAPEQKSLSEHVSKYAQALSNPLTFTRQE